MLMHKHIALIDSLNCMHHVQCHGNAAAIMKLISENQQIFSESSYGQTFRLIITKECSSTLHPSVAFDNLMCNVFPLGFMGENLPPIPSQRKPNISIFTQICVYGANENAAAFNWLLLSIL